MKFGEMLRSLRIEHEISLRDLAANSELDLDYLSRIERGTLRPPQENEMLEAITSALGLDPSEAILLQTQARIDGDYFPSEVVTSDEMSGIPLLSRTGSNEQSSVEEIRSLAAFIHANY